MRAVDAVAVAVRHDAAAGLGALGLVEAQNRKRDAGPVTRPAVSRSWC